MKVFSTQISIKDEKQIHGLIGKKFPHQFATDMQIHEQRSDL